MSRAFTKEIDDAPAERIHRLGVPVPELNFVTPAGLAAAKAELERLVRAGGDADRIRELTEHLATAQPLEPTDREVVGIGARVTVEDDDGKRTSYRIVGAIEADAKLRALSWQSPLAQALWGARVGDTCTLPRGGDIQVVEVTY